MGEMADYSLESQMWPEDAHWPSSDPAVLKTQRRKETMSAMRKGSKAPAPRGRDEEASKGKGAEGSGMKIHIPEGLGGDLKLIEGTGKAALEKIVWGVSKANQPKATFMYTLLDELNEDPDAPTTVGERVLETYSLQPQALFKLNETYKEATGEGLPTGDFSVEEFHTLIEEALLNTEWTLALVKGMDDKGKDRTEVSKRVFLGK